MLLVHAYRYIHAATIYGVCFFVVVGEAKILQISSGVLMVLFLCGMTPRWDCRPMIRHRSGQRKPIIVGISQYTTGIIYNSYTRYMEPTGIHPGY